MMYVCTCVCMDLCPCVGACMCLSLCRHACVVYVEVWKTTLWSWFSPSAFMWVLGIELRSSSLHSEWLYLLNPMVSSVTQFYPTHCILSLVLFVGRGCTAGVRHDRQGINTQYALFPPGSERPGTGQSLLQFSMFNENLLNDSLRSNHCFLGCPLPFNLL